MTESKGRVWVMVYTGMAESRQNNRIPNPEVARSSRAGRTSFQSLSGGDQARFTGRDKPNLRITRLAPVLA